MKYYIGADPELFLTDADGVFRSAHNVIKGTKEAPFEVLNGAIQVDGVAAEFNILPAETADQFHGHIRDVLSELASRVEAKNKGLRLIVTPTAHFDKAYFRKLPAKAKLLGCQPDYNVYLDGKANPPPATKEPFRTGAGHIHVGWGSGMNPSEDAHLFDCHEAVKQLDAVLYFNSLLWDSDQKRRELYGKMGTFRPKHYGVEYRPLSNAWVADPDLHYWIFDATMKAMTLLDDEARIHTDYLARAMVSDAKEGKDISRIRLLEYHDFLHEHYAIPKLPESYIRTYQ